MNRPPAPGGAVEFPNDRAVEGPPLRERVLYVPRMSVSSARCFTATLRAFGLNAVPFPASDGETLELGGRYTSGEECFPERLTLGDALKIVMAPGAQPERIAFFMPHAPGPCRFGQYAPFLRRVLDSVGAEAALVVSPSSTSGYQELGIDTRGLQRALWRSLLVADILRKALLRVRPYEAERGMTDAVHASAVAAVERELEQGGRSGKEMMAALAGT